MIVKLNGPSGSGKSTIARYFINKGNGVPFYDEDNKKKIAGYRCEHPDWTNKVLVLGDYTATCGGYDALLPDHQIELLDNYRTLGYHMLYESMLTSTYFGKFGKWVAGLGNQHVSLYLDTPLDECIRRVVQRRAEKGNTEAPIRDRWVTKINQIEAARKNYAKAGCATFDVSSAEGVEQWFKKN